MDLVWPRSRFVHSAQQTTRPQRLAFGSAAVGVFAGLALAAPELASQSPNDSEARIRMRLASQHGADTEARLRTAKASQQAADSEARFRKALTTLQHLSTGELLYDRLEPELFQLAEATPRADALALLKHADSKVRALAVAVVGVHGDPRALPALVALAGDKGEAPPSRSRILGAAWLPGMPAQPQYTEHAQTVGDLARGVVGMWMAAAGYLWGIEGQGGQPGFAAYWAERATRTHCLSWFLVELQRASGGTLPLAEERRPKVAALRKAIDALPTPYGEWVLLGLGAPWGLGGRLLGAEALASEADLIRAARRLGPARTMDLLRGKDPYPDDPDLRLRPRSPFAFERVAPFLLSHAREVLQPEHAGELLQLELRHANAGGPLHLGTARWAVAAADLDPANALAILDAADRRFGAGGAFDRQDQRMLLAEARLRHGGAAAFTAVQEWFFRDVPQRGAFGFGRTRFAASLGEPERRALLLAILRDERMADLDWQTLRVLATATNQAAGRPVVSDEELRSAWHPLGEAHYQWEKAKAEKEFPAETAALEAALARWRGALKAFARAAR
ncbi:MAG: hypothetical protein IT458_20125 [Planctomycetes bacterium]|nr:hypothetical protein [Planctomycetota bacterium]